MFITTFLLFISISAWGDCVSPPIEMEKIPNNRVRKHQDKGWNVSKSYKMNLAEELSSDSKLDQKGDLEELSYSFHPGIISTETGGNPTTAVAQPSCSKPSHLGPMAVPPSASENQTIEALIGVFYYPWYNGVGFNGGKYMRKMLKPPQLPALGEYNDRDPKVLSQHFKWCKQANIGLWVTSWWGPNSRTDIDGMKVALFYETTGRIPLFKTGSPNLSNIASDIQYMAKTYFKHPNYLRIDNRPVLVVYRTRSMPSLENVIVRMREAATNTGYSLYIIGDEAFGKAPTSRASLNYLDGIANYDVYGSLHPGGYYAGQSAVDAYFNQQRKWRALANAAGKGYIPGITPGYNDLGIRNVGHMPLSRQLDASSDFGSLFRSMIKQALPLVDDRAKRIMLITSWNEWMEDTMIEPVLNGTGVTKFDLSSSGQFYTKGIKYDDYGELYLNILKEETFYPPSNSSVIATFATDFS